MTDQGLQEGEIQVDKRDPTLLRKCSWCIPPAKEPPLPKGFRGYSDGVCNTHFAKIMGLSAEKKIDKEEK